jgi:hypothetical protein
MTQDSRLALQQLIAAFERHFEAVSARRGPGDAAVENAYFDLAKAFEAYEYVLDSDFEELLPIMLADDEEGN